MNVFKLLLLPVFLLGSTPSGNAQQGGEEAVRQVLARQSSDWNAGNIEAFMQGYWNHDSLMFAGKKAE